ncbi:MAG: hypothetical protein PHR06_13125 [Candidatus Cloacimonetes bacterium]|nr:hypothetical protein [Candidatus Cloacimonadota bacterium]
MERELPSRPDAKPILLKDLAKVFETLPEAFEKQAERLAERNNCVYFNGILYLRRRNEDTKTAEEMDRIREEYYQLAEDHGVIDNYVIGALNTPPLKGNWKQSDKLNKLIAKRERNQAEQRIESIGQEIKIIVEKHNQLEATLANKRKPSQTTEYTVNDLRCLCNCKATGEAFTTALKSAGIIYKTFRVWVRRHLSIIKTFYPEVNNHNDFYKELKYGDIENLIKQIKENSRKLKNE